MKNIIDKMLKDINISDPKAVYAFGSQVYGTKTNNSDYDFYVITDDITKSFEYKSDVANAHVYNVEQFNQLLVQHHIGALECHFAPIEFRFFENDKFDFHLDKVTLRHSISQTCSNSFVKAKKKFDVENEPYIAKKSLFHSIRILLFGIQIAKHGKIINFKTPQIVSLYNDIMSSPHNNWEPYKEKYKPIFNYNMSAFRMECPK